MTDNDVLVQSANLRCAKQVDGLSVMNPDTGVYYSLSETAAFIWECLERPTSIAAVKKSAAARYRVSPEAVALQIDAFITEMSAEGLVKASEHPAARGENHGCGMGPVAEDR